jgi:pyruvate/2-oxoacid:ferredoxin oxidoreductase beta subunit
MRMEWKETKMSTPAEEAKPIVKKKKKVPFDYSPYIRGGKLPHIWCPGCGHGIVLKALLRAAHASGIAQNDVAMVPCIPCMEGQSHLQPG